MRAWNAGWIAAVLWLVGLPDVSRATGLTPHARPQGSSLPPTLAFAPNGGQVASGTAITVSAIGGDPGASASYLCDVPPGVTVSNAQATLMTGAPTQILNVSCPAGVTDALMMCTRTGGDNTPIPFLIDCPNQGIPLITTPPGGTLTCDAATGATAQVSVSISNPSGVAISGVSCSVAGTGFAITTPPPATIAPGTSGQVTLVCTPPAFGQGARLGVLNCSSATPPASASFALSSSALSVAPQPAQIPALLPWAVIGMLIGIAAISRGRMRES